MYTVLDRPIVDLCGELPRRREEWTIWEYESFV
jgi:hypothetical protein